MVRDGFANRFGLLPHITPTTGQGSKQLIWTTGVLLRWATNETKSINSAVFLSKVGIGSWLSTVLVKIVITATGGQQKGWLRSNNLNYSRLDWFYWILTCLNAINFLVYLFVAKSYKGKESAVSVRDVNMVELSSRGQHTQP
ncbi:hypothetical protein P8452_43126 [Trifolium repens]|nr:hypothetical protein P8452_43126 [Trifolium repens]